MAKKKNLASWYFSLKYSSHVRMVPPPPGANRGHWHISILFIDEAGPNLYFYGKHIEHLQGFVQ